jgi:hypothetical protein
MPTDTTSRSFQKIIHKTNQPKLFFELEKLYGTCYESVRNFPKLDKHLLGKEILQFLNETHKYSLLSIHNKSYLPFASANFDLFKKSLTIALDRKMISYGWYSAQLKTTVSIGKTIGSWIKKTK